MQKTGTRGGEQRYRRLTNDEVLANFNLATAQIELSVARLKWMQAMVRAPEQHHLMLTALFGVLRCEEEAGVEVVKAHTEAGFCGAPDMHPLSMTTICSAIDSLS